MNNPFFQFPASWTSSESEPPPAPSVKTSPKSHLKSVIPWRILTHSPGIQAKLVEMINEVGCLDFCETPTYFFDRTHADTVAISEEMAMEIAAGDDPDYVLLHKLGSTMPWSYSEKYSRGDVEKYFGSTYVRVNHSAVSPLSKKKKK